MYSYIPMPQIWGGTPKASLTAVAKSMIYTMQ